MGASVTRLGLYGGARGRYGSFAGKTEEIIIPSGAKIKYRGFLKNAGRLMR